MKDELGTLAVSTVDLVATKSNRHEYTVLKQLDIEIANVLNRASFFDAAPFRRVNITLRLGTKEQKLPKNLGIDSDGWLELAIETEAEILNWKIQLADYVKRKFLPPVCRALQYAAERYSLPIDGLDGYEERIIAGDTE